MSKAGRIPIVALILVAANLVAAFAAAFRPELVAQFGFVAARPSTTTIFASQFLHLNLLHLLGNMVFLAAVGPAVELAAGSLRFATVYLLGGLGGVGAHALLAAPDAAPMIGASGAVAACAAYYSLHYLSLRVPLAPKLGASIAALVGVWLVLQVAGAFLSWGGSGGTAYWAHLGGFATGLVLGLVMKAPSMARLELGHAVLREMNARSPAAAVAAARRHLEEHPSDLAAMRELAAALGRLGDIDEEAAVWCRILDLTPESGQAPALRELDRLQRLSVLPSLRRTLLAERFKDPDPETARRLLQSVVEGSQDDPQRPDAMLALVALERETSPSRAQDLLAELLRIYPMHPAAELARTRGWAS
ncbi:MAG: rhomboid family intramembrane serine protease [Fimbriimonadaceae bacterium]|nr:rhomboid family intramembrane serine protease [Chthonomonadaceae bacterium]MCO5296705.1 rhomboid family intramembrane serine protease [Fimbriimonadaceae bacterium]